MNKKSLTTIATFFAAVIMMLSVITLSSSVASAQTTYDGKQDARISALEAKRRGKGGRSHRSTGLSPLEKKQNAEIDNLKWQRNVDVADQKARDDGQDRDLVYTDDRVDRIEDRLNLHAALVYSTGFWGIIIGAALLAAIIALIVVLVRSGRRNNNRCVDIETRIEHLENDTDALDAANAAQTTANMAVARANGAHNRIDGLRRTVVRNNRDNRREMNRVQRRFGHEIGLIQGRVETLETPPYITGIINTVGGRAEAPAAGGDMMRVSGGNFTAPASVTVNGVAATNVAVLNDSTLEFTAPAGTGTAHVVVTSGGRNAIGMFNYV